MPKNVGVILKGMILTSAGKIDHDFFVTSLSYHPPPPFASRVKFPTVFHGIDLANVNPSKVVDVERCHIATDGINVALPPAREAARKRVDDAFSSGQGKRVGKRGATLLFRETTEQGTVTDNTADVSERVDGMVFNFKVGVRVFFHGRWLCFGLCC